MKQWLIVGKPKVGKTLFLLSLAEYAGQRTVNMIIEKPDYSVASQAITIREAKDRLVGAAAHTTRAIQSIVVPVPSGKGRVQVEISDTPGIHEGISPDTEIRRAMAQALRKVKTADLVIHILDPFLLAKTAVGPGPAAVPGDIDQEIARFGRYRGGYLILVNKMDLPEAEEGFMLARQAFQGTPVLGVSALTRKGFREVMHFVRQHL